ncbi:transporter substrate-binding domain-containing protein [Micromonospora sp. NPDC049171]|uniref:transporter substrate-binding domain-containing protein n=1 Tax=Micromonospora sp. NPDC049171 TaxID=3155770 RepID=UPI0033DD7DDA
MTQATTANSTSTEPVPVPVRHSISRQLFWLLPVALASVGICVLLFQKEAWGANAAAIISVPINIAAIVVTILVDRGVFKTPALRKPGGRSWRMKGAVYFTAGTLVLSAAFWWFQREPDPFDYMSGEVRIGYNAFEYEGWHTDKDGGTGFDVALANEIQSHFENAHLKWVDLGTLDNRINALHGKWRATDQSPLQKPVKLVISNFSITPERAEVIDFAGPYFVDTQGFLSRSDAKTIAAIPRGKVCAIKGSTTFKRLDQINWNPVPADSIAECINRYKSGEVDAVSGDRSVLAGYARAVGVSPPIRLSNGSEKYAIGIPNNMPRLCGELSKVITDFLEYGWQTNFDTTLGALGLSESPPPQAVEPCQPAGPWLDR